jgi:rare lipoprotein A
VLAIFILLILGCAPAPRYTTKVSEQFENSKSAGSHIGSRETEKENPGKAAKDDNAEVGQIHEGYSEIGYASYYGYDCAGNKTANGEKFNPNGMTAAHRTLPFNTLVRVTNLSNSMSVVVRVNDRGPHARNRIIDLAYGAAKQIDMVKTGHEKVKIEVVTQP